jgi:hypothetical protein
VKDNSSQQFWAIAQNAEDVLNREQQLKLARYLCSLHGAVVVFPQARESAMRKELVKATQKGSAPPKQRLQAKPENAAMKGTVEEQLLHHAQTALRQKRIALGLAKNDSTDNRLKAEIEAIKVANSNFQSKKASLKKD